MSGEYRDDVIECAAAVVRAWERAEFQNDKGGLESVELGELRRALWRLGVYEGIIPDETFRAWEKTRVET